MQHLPRAPPRKGTPCLIVVQITGDWPCAANLGVSRSIGVQLSIDLHTLRGTGGKALDSYDGILQEILGSKSRVEETGMQELSLEAEAPGMLERSLKAEASGMLEDLSQPRTSGTLGNSAKVEASGVPEWSLKVEASGMLESELKVGESGKLAGSLKVEASDMLERLLKVDKSAMLKRSRDFHQETNSETLMDEAGLVQCSGSGSTPTALSGDSCWLGFDHASVASCDSCWRCFAHASMSRSTTATGSSTVSTLPASDEAGEGQADVARELAAAHSIGRISPSRPRAAM